MVKTVQIQLSILLLAVACSKPVAKPQFEAKTESGNIEKNPSPGVNPVSPTPGIPGPNPQVSNPVVVQPTPGPDLSKRSFELADGKALKLGSKQLPACKEDSGAEESGIGTYLNFEVTEDDTNLTVSIEGLCGNQSKDSVVSIIRASDGKIVGSKGLPIVDVTKKTLVLQQGGLPKGRYSIAIEAGGTTLANLSSFVVSGILVESEKDLKFEGPSAF